MRLSKFSDYALRILMTAASSGEERMTIEQAAAIFGISQAHLKKVVLALTRTGFLRGIKGRSGGFVLARKPEEINLGAVLRITETDFGIFECFQPEGHCRVGGVCRLADVGNRAVAAFLAAFDEVTLADIQLAPGALRFDPVEPA